MVRSWSPALKTKAPRRLNEWNNTKTTIAANRLCQPTVIATADNSSSTHPIHRALSPGQTSKTLHW